MTMAARPWSHIPGGLRLMVRLTPRAGRDSLGGLREIEPGESLLLARVNAPPRCLKQCSRP